jgi:hypothetical protein
LPRRARIAANELEEQLARVFEIWAWAVAAAVLLVLAVVMASAASCSRCGTRTACLPPAC